MLITGLISEFITKEYDVKRDIDRISGYYLDNSEQYTVGSENVIILLADAVDNSFIKDIIDNDPAFFDDYCDFTLYDNTCSIYENTAGSVPQMLYGYTQKEGTERTIQFFNRFVDDGYRILIFSYDALGAPGEPENYIDNYIYSSSAVHIRYDRIRQCMFKLTLYQFLPCILKDTTHANRVNWDFCLDNNPKNVSSIDYYNDEFLVEGKLSTNLYSDKCFIFQHIDGAHVPSDDFVEDTKLSLNLFKEYIEQMKTLGCYDDSCIIICSDHGQREVMEPIAATPMFMIKGKNEKHEKIQISNKPMYYQDIPATVLKYSGLYEDGDDKIFGKSIDEYGENDLRTRVWFNSINSEIRKYTFIGDKHDLERVIQNNEYEVVDDYSFDYNELINR